MSERGLTLEDLNKYLESLRDPETGRSLARTKQLVETSIDGQTVRLKIGLTSHSAPIRQRLRQKFVDEISNEFPDCQSVEIEFVEHQRPTPTLGQIGLKCKSVIAVGSGKGGVGKSTVATCLAIGLKRMGCRVGLMDADVYGPSIPQLTGAAGQPAQSGNKIAPIDFDGIPIMSIGFMVAPDQAVIWRGPMLHSAVTQFLRDTDWGELDYLIIDMPPGTGDVALTLSQLIPASGAVVVCTPQKVALLDAIKAAAMFEKVNIPLLGIVENMSSFICPDNGKSYDIFGKGGARRLAEQINAPFLGELPIYMEIRQRGDNSDTASNFDDPQIAPYLEGLAIELVWSLAEKAAAEPTKPDLPVLQ